MARFAIIGLGRFGRKVAEYLTQRGAEVLAVDQDKERVEEIKDKVSHAVILDATDSASLKSIGVDEMDAVIVGVGEDFEASVMAVALARKLGVKRIVAKASTDLQGEILTLVGADEVLFPEDSEALRLARTLMEPNIIDHIQITDDQSMIKVIVPTIFFDKSIVDLNLRNKFGVTVLEVSRKVGEKDEITTLPAPDFIFRVGDILVVIGEKERMEKFRKICAQ